MFTAQDLARLHDIVDLVECDQFTMPAELVDETLPSATFVMGQTAMSRERLDAAPNLKAILNVEGNFTGNIDYETCFERGIHVLSVSPVFTETVAEMALGMAIDLGRGISKADRDFHEGNEVFGGDSNLGTELLFDAPVGIIGYGDLARSFRPLLKPFRCPIKVHDPWLPDHVLIAEECQPASLGEVLASSRFIFVFATVTASNEGFLGVEQFASMQKGAKFILVSRAGVVNFDAMLDAVESGHILVATDVFPEEPMPAGHRVRDIEGILLSAHRAGAIDSVFKRMGTLLLGDMELMLRGLPPVGCKRAQRETVATLRSKAVEIS
ncbi:MAG: hydroxyacid dehydrogenase [Pseudomonadota bacterium]